MARLHKDPPHGSWGIEGSSHMAGDHRSTMRDRNHLAGHEASNTIDARKDVVASCSFLNEWLLEGGSLRNW